MPDQPKRNRQSPRPLTRQTRPRTEERTLKAPSVPLIAISIALLVAVVLLARFCAAAATIDVTVNGASLTLHGAKTMQAAIRESGLPINPGDYLSLGGTVLKKSAGEPFAATVNGVETADPNYQLRGGEIITITDGKDTVEGCDIVTEPIPFGATLGGVGAVRRITPGEDGVLEICTGKDSGEVVTRVRTSPTSATCEMYNPDVGGDKPICLTFNGGPSEAHTGQILDVLKENDARATFFCTEVDADGKDAELVKRASEERHQVCAGTYERSQSASAGSTATPSGEELTDQLKRERSALSTALGGAEASRVVRLPGGSLSEDVVRELSDFATVEVGWNLDTGDWLEPGVDAIYRVLMQVEAGDIVLLHDGANDSSDTAEALRRALPRLRDQGFYFVTIDEVLDYPPQA